MFDNVFETIIRGSSTIFLDIPEDDFFFCYDDLDLESANDITQNYFKLKSREGIPHVKEVTLDPATHTVKISVDVENYWEHKLDHYNIPDTLNITRRQ